MCRVEKNESDLIHLLLKEKNEKSVNTKNLINLLRLGYL